MQPGDKPRKHRGATGNKNGRRERLAKVNWDLVSMQSVKGSTTQV